jgi:hypothetical protein
MLGEKEEIRRIRNSLGAGMSRDLIAKKLMNRGYKYDYVSLLMKKAESHKKMLIWILLTIVILGLLAWAVYGNFFATKNIKLDIANPLDGIQVANLEISDITNGSLSAEATQNISQIKVTPEFMTYLLGIINAQNYLHNVPLTNNVPIINFRTEEDNFYSIIDGNIETFIGKSDSADIEFYIPKEIVIMTTASENSKEYFLEKVNLGEVSTETLAGETELFSKGYLNFYNSLTV